MKRRKRCHFPALRPSFPKVRLDRKRVRQSRVGGLARSVPGRVDARRLRCDGKGNEGLSHSPRRTERVSRIAVLALTPNTRAAARHK